MERRSSLLAEEYRKPLAVLDQRYHGTRKGDAGPLVKRLKSYGQLQGLVVGAFQEGSDDIHALLDVVADSQLKARGLARGREGSNHEREHHIGWSQEETQHGGSQGLLCLPHGQGGQGGGGAQAGSKEKGMGQEGADGGGKESILAGICPQLGRKRGRFVG